MARKTYPPEFRQHLVALVRQGRSAESLAREFEPTAQTIRGWVKTADAVVAGETPVDKDALIRDLMRKVATLEEEKEILKKAAAWFAKESSSSRTRGSGS